MANNISINQDIFDLLQAAKVTLVEIRGICCHGNVPYMPKNCRIFSQDTQRTNATLKNTENEAPMGSMASFSLK